MRVVSACGNLAIPDRVEICLNVLATCDLVAATEAVNVLSGLAKGDPGISAELLRVASDPRNTDCHRAFVISAIGDSRSPFDHTRNWLRKAAVGDRPLVRRAAIRALGSLRVAEDDTLKFLSEILLQKREEEDVGDVLACVLAIRDLYKTTDAAGEGNADEVKQ
jgi:hypothetical protein